MAGRSLCSASYQWPDPDVPVQHIRILANAMLPLVASELLVVVLMSMLAPLQ